MEKEIEEYKKQHGDPRNWKYYKDHETHIRINRILKRMMHIECHSGTDNTPEENAKNYKRKQLLYYAIRQWDEEFYGVIKP